MALVREPPTTTYGDGPRGTPLAPLDILLADADYNGKQMVVGWTKGRIRLAKGNGCVNLFASLDLQSSIRGIMQDLRGLRAIIKGRDVYRHDVYRPLPTDNNPNELFVCALVPGEYRFETIAPGYHVLWWMNNHKPGTSRPVLEPEVLSCSVVETSPKIRRRPIHTAPPVELPEAPEPEAAPGPSLKRRPLPPNGGFDRTTLRRRLI